MARFYGEINGKANTSATREGTEKSGMTAHIRGWDIGIYIQCYVNDKGKDAIKVMKTNGSNDPSTTELIGVYEASK